MFTNLLIAIWNWDTLGRLPNLTINVRKGANNKSVNEERAAGFVADHRVFLPVNTPSIIPGKDYK